ncbi:MAG: PAS domain S-box protein, partial [Ilumatobacteraceae bacterium]
MDAPPRIDETARLAALARLGILDTPPEERFDRITRLATRLLGTPIALVSLVDQHRQWFKSVVGLDVRETPREVAFCDHAITGTAAALVVPDASLDVRFRDNPLVTGDPNIRFYAGHVIHDPGGQPVGTLCIIGPRPRQPDADELAVLADLAAMAEAELARTDEIDLLLRRDDDERATRSLLDALDEGLIMAGSDGRLVQWNRRAEQILGLSAGDLLDRRVDDDRWGVVHTDESPWEPSRLPAAVAMRTGVEVCDQMMGISRDGVRRWLRAQCRPILDGVGNVTSVVIAFTDITDDLEVRATSAALTERLRVAINDSPLGTALTDELGRFSYVNDAYAELLGRPADELVGRPSLEQIHPDDVGVGADEITALMEGRRHELTLELRVLDTAGRVKHVRSHATRLERPVPDAAYLIHVEDITAPHELTRALHRSEEIARTSLESLDEGVMLVDASARVHLMNPAAECILGTDHAGIAARLRSGRPTTTYEDGRTVPVGERAVDQALATGRPVRDRIIQWERDDGEHVLLRLAAIPTELGDGSAGAVIAFTDITGRRALELELERYGILFEHANDIITVIGADGHVRYASPSSTRVLGYGDDWHHPEGVLGLVHPDDLPDARAELAALMEDDRGHQDTFTVRVRAADGEWRHLECVGVNLLDEPAVRGLVITSRDMTERQHLLDELAHRATHDLLTDLPNRTVLGDQLAAALARTERASRHVGLCYLDLDGFKAVNDSFGHAAGDELLVEMASRLHSAVRTGDTPARIGGDEFVVILDPVASDDDAAQVATRIRDAVLGADGLHVGDVRCGVSVGVAGS